MDKKNNFGDTYEDYDRATRGLLDGLADIVNDLYGMNRRNAAELARKTSEESPLAGVTLDVPPTPGAVRPHNTSALRTVKPPRGARLPQSMAEAESVFNLGMPFSSVAPQAKAQPAAAPQPVPAESEKPAAPTLDDLWKTADETIDWTEALASVAPTDGLTDPEKWKLYHENAQAVLHGDVAAYLTVLKAADPMADLLPFAADLDVTASSADELNATFNAQPDMLAEEPKRYLSAVSLRIARDLFAVLPVTEVRVVARQEEKELLSVRFTRQGLNKVRFAFIDPAEFVAQCGGTFDC